MAVSIATLRAAGLTAEQIVNVLEEDQKREAVEEEERLAAQRERKRISKRNQRSRPQMSPETPATSGDTPSPSLPPSNGFPTPLPITPPLTPPSPTPSLRSGNRRPPASWSFPAFWQQYPHKIGKQDALKAFERIGMSGRVTIEELMAGLSRYCAKTDDRPWCNPATWLNQGRWEDQPAVDGGRNGTHWRGREPSIRERQREATAEAYEQLSRYADAYANGSRPSDDHRQENLGLLSPPKPARPADVHRATDGGLFEVSGMGRGGGGAGDTQGVSGISPNGGARRART